jgi:putative copper export protein
MLALRLASLLALAVWVGGLVVLGAVAAPAIFEVVGLRQVAEGRVLAGAIFGEILRRFHLVAYSCGAIVILTLITRAVLGPRPRQFAIRFSLAVVMLATTLYSGLIVSKRIERLRIEAGTAPSTLDAADLRRVAFEQLHARSVVLQFVPLVGGVILLLFEGRE